MSFLYCPSAMSAIPHGGLRLVAQQAACRKQLILDRRWRDRDAAPSFTGGIGDPVAHRAKRNAAPVDPRPAPQSRKKARRAGGREKHPEMGRGQRSTPVTNAPPGLRPLLEKKKYRSGEDRSDIHHISRHAQYQYKQSE